MTDGAVYYLPDDSKLVDGGVGWEEDEAEVVIAWTKSRAGQREAFTRVSG